VITDCSHSGLHNILKAAARFVEIHGVVGGFHGFKDFDILNDIKLISPCRCRGHKKEIAHTFPKQYGKCGAGLVIE
jgi:7,8-dihydropterin-6-yl-methyl-4-(beta-D-ribofuranosyl)aminobenzene 5'-phosphate synthase